MTEPGLARAPDRFCSEQSLFISGDAVDKVKLIALRADIKVLFRKYILHGRIKEMLAAIVAKGVGSFLYRDRISLQDAADILSTQQIFVGTAKTCRPHRYDGNLFRISIADIGGYGIRIDQRGADDFISMHRIDDALCTGTGGVNDGAAGQVASGDLGRGVAVVTSLYPGTAPFAAEQPIRMLSF